ncbi:MAG: MMPL family transporter [Actinomycetota bacterium]|nr:MMPL family transporter [Actinomycetota bacterium]
MRLARGYAKLVVRLRWLVLLNVAVGTWAALTMLPGVATAGGELSGIAAAGGPAIQAQLDAAQRFGLPLLTRTAVVQRDPDGLDPQATQRAVLRALEIDRRTLNTGLQPGRDIFLALPLVNSPRLVPAAGEQNTTIVTYLFANPTLSFNSQVKVAGEYAAGFDQPDDALVGVAGTIPTQVQARMILDRTLPLVEAATLVAIALIVGLTFRSVVAPLITLVTAAVGYLLADRVIGWLAGVADLTVPVEIQPIVVALMLGITTDYSIFFLSGLRRRLRAGQTNPAATRDAVGEYLAIVVAAGVIVAAGVAALVVAESDVFRAFGPGLAVTVLIGLAVAVVLVPAMLAVLGRWAFWPYGLAGGRLSEPHAQPEGGVEPVDAAAGAVSVSPVEVVQTTGTARLIRHRWVSAVVAAGVIAGLAVASVPLSELRSGVSPVDTLPPGNQVRDAAAAAAAGFSPGILSPTGLIVSDPGITDRRAALTTLAGQLKRQPGVDIVFGPGDPPLSDQPLLGQALPEQFGLFLSPGGGAARFLVVFDSDPLGATAVGHLRELREAMPHLLATSGLAGAEVSYLGDTTIGLSLADQARADLVRVAVAVGLVNLVLLVLFLRALVAPLYLLVINVLAVGATLGLTVALFQGQLGHDGLIFFVPFTAAVLLVSLGSDYTVFSVGYIWQEARRRPLREALTVAVPRSTHAINAAGITLAASFAMLALIPLMPFRQLAFAMAVGVLIDAFIVRSLLVPALISLVGRASGWPGKRLARPRAVD